MGSRMLGNDAGSIARNHRPSNQSTETFNVALNELRALPDEKTQVLASPDQSETSVEGSRADLPIVTSSSGANVRFRYRERVRQFARKWPQAELLVSYLDQDWSQRDARIQAAFTKFIVSDVLESGESNTFELGCSDLKNEPDIQDALIHAVADTRVRLIVVPDITPAVASLLGDTFEINPLVFAVALQNIWTNSDLGPEAVNRLSPDGSFGESLFSYDAETEISTSLMFFANQSSVNEFYAGLISPQITDILDTAVMEQDCSDKFGSRALSAIHPILCPPLRKSAGGIAELWRSYRAINRLTCFRVARAEIPIFLLLTTSSNDWCERDRHLFEAARLHYDLPSWVERLTSRISKQLSTSIVSIQTRDNGNPFFSAFLGPSSSIARWWQEVGSQTENDDEWETLAGYYTRDLLPIVSKHCQSPANAMFAIDIWATKRSMEAFAETLGHLRVRLDWFKANVELYKTISISERIQILRKHRDALESSRERIEAHIKNFKVSSLRAMHSDELHAQYRTEVETMLLGLQETQMGMQAVIQTNEKLIQDCLFDLQLELASTQLLESRRSIEQNATVKRLTALAFVFIPISTVAGIFGMNIHGLVDVEVWIFLVVAAAVLVISFVVAGQRTVRGILSAVEAMAFRHARLGVVESQLEHAQISTAKPRRVRALRSTLSRIWRWVLALPARTCVLFFALVSLLYLPIEIAGYFIQRSIDFGITQEKVHAKRRLKIKDQWARDMMRLSVLSWREQNQNLAWWKQALWEIAFVPALIYAYLAHHLDPHI